MVGSQSYLLSRAKVPYFILLMQNAPGPDFVLKKNENCVEGFPQVKFGRDFDRDYDLFMIKVGNDPIFLS